MVNKRATMSITYVYISLFVIVSVNGEFLIKKSCKDVNWQTCDIHHLVVQCQGDASLCSIRRGKTYTATVDFTPHFSAQSLFMEMYADDGNTDTFNKTIKAPQTACDVMTCPIEAETRRIFDYNFVLDKSLYLGKYPVKVKFWNPDNVSQVCCFTFIVKVFK